MTADESFAMFALSLRCPVLSWNEYTATTIGCPDSGSGNGRLNFVAGAVSASYDLVKSIGEAAQPASIAEISSVIRNFILELELTHWYVNFSHATIFANDSEIDFIAAFAICDCVAL